MKVLALLIALVASASAFPSGILFGEDSEDKGGMGGKNSKPCRIVKTNGKVKENPCVSPNNFLTCQEVNIEETKAELMLRMPQMYDDIIPMFPSTIRWFAPFFKPMILNQIYARIERYTANKKEISLCLPKKCSFDTECTSYDPASKCTRKIVPDFGASQRRMSLCMGPNVNIPEIPDLDFDFDGEARCSIPTDFVLEKTACSITAEGVTNTTECDKMSRCTDTSNPCWIRLGDKTATVNKMCVPDFDISKIIDMFFSGGFQLGK